MELHLYSPPIFLNGVDKEIYILPLLVVLNRPVPIWAEAACYPMGTVGSFPVKKPGHLFDQSPPSSAKVKNTCIYRLHPVMEGTEITLLYFYTKMGGRDPVTGPVWPRGFQEV
jgi:hypothetical protein